MDSMQDMLSGILSDPEALSKIKNLSNELGLTSENNQQSSTKKESSSPPFDLSALTSLLSPNKKSESPLQDPQMLGLVTKFIPLIESLKEEDESTALLYALRPFLSSDRQKRLDDAGKMLRIMRILPMIKGTGLL